ncbi:MAG: hypothetical protein ACFFBP_13915 [Promethearchaeota archaeon]
MTDSDSLIDIKITCPACNTKGYIQIKKEIILSSNRGITAVNVAEDLVCEHSFVAYIDRNLAIRDSFICDFKIDLPIVEIKTYEEFVASKDYDVDIIKLNLLPSLMVNVLKGIFMGKKIIIISHNEFISNNFLGFFKNITNDSFPLELRAADRVEYKKNKKLYKDSLILDSTSVINDKDKIINEKNIKIEGAIVQKFFSEPDSKISVILIKNEINKIYILSQALIEFNKNFNEKKRFTLKQALDFFEKEYNFKMQIPFLEFLENVVEKRFNVVLHRTDKVIDFFGVL